MLFRSLAHPPSRVDGSTLAWLAEGGLTVPFDPGWSKLTIGGTGFANAHVTPAAGFRFVTVSPKKIGSDIDFTIKVRSVYPTAQVQSSGNVVKVKSTPSENP